MKRDAVKHFADDLNQRVDVPPHPSHAGINLIREGKAQFLGKGDDGLAFDTQDGQVTKVTTSVPYNLAYFRDHQHAIADARRQVELTNQAIADGHDLLVPQQFIEHGEKGFTTMPRLDLNADLTREQIIDYRNKMRAFTEAGWRVGDDVQTGVDDQGNIRIYDTGKLTRTAPGDDDSWQQDRHPGQLLREHGHYDDETLDNELKIHLQHLKWAATDPQYAENLPEETRNVSLTLQTMIQNEHDAAPFVIDDVREVLDMMPDSEHKQEIATYIDFWESDLLNDVMDTRMLDAQAAFADLVTEYEGIDDDDEPHNESLDDHITNKDLFEQMVADLSPEQLGMLGFKAYESWGDEINLAGFAMDEDVLRATGDEGRVMREIAELQESRGLNLQGEELQPGQVTSDGGHYEPEREPDMDAFMRNQYPEGDSLGPAGFIMADGALLDMSVGGGEQRGEDHRSIIPTEEAAQRWGWAMDGQGDSGEGSSSRWGLLVQTLAKSGAIRFDPTGLLHLEAAPTYEQQRVIANYINDYEPDYLSIRFGNGQNDALQEWDVDNPTASQVLEQIERAASGQQAKATDTWQMTPRDEWPEQHSLAMEGGGSLGWIDMDDYLGAIPAAILGSLEETLESEIDDKEWSMREGDEFPPLLFYKNGKNAESVATALAAQRLGWQSVPVITEPDYKPEYEAPGTPEFAAWFGNSKVVNPDGSPRAYMHGTTADDDFTMFETMRGRDIGSHFGDLSQATQFVETHRDKGPKYHDNARIIPVWLSIQNPLVTDDMGRWDVDEITEYMADELEARGIPWPAFISDDDIPNRNDWNDEVMDLVPEVQNEHAWFNNHLGAWEKFKERKNWLLLRDALEAAGFDGIAYNNIWEGDGEDNLAFIALRPEQIKSVTGNSGAFDPTDPRIRYAADDMEGYQPPKPGQEFTKAKGVQTQMADPSAVAEQSEMRMDYEESDGAAVRAEHLEPYEHVEPERVPKVEKNPESLKWLAAKFEEYDPSAKDPLGQLLATDWHTWTRQEQQNYTNNMARMGYNTLKGMPDKVPPEVLEEAEKHYEQAFPQQPEQPTGWEDDDYLYHVAPVSVADAIARQGLKPNQESNFEGDLEFNIRGNVFLTEKSGVRDWQRMVGSGAGARLDNELFKQEQKLREMESNADQFENDWGDAVYDNSEPWVTDSWETIQADLMEAREHKDRLKEMRDNLEDDYENHTKVFRVPKKHVQGVAATDELGTQDAAGKAFKINNWVSSQVRNAKEQVGVVQKQMSDAQQAIKQLDNSRQQSLDNRNTAVAKLDAAYSDLAGELRTTRDAVTSTAPEIRQVQYTVKMGQSESGEKESQLYMQNPFTGEPIHVLSMPYESDDHDHDAASLTTIFKNLILNIHDLDAPIFTGDQPMNEGNQVATIHWPEQAASEFRNEEGREYMWIPEGWAAFNDWMMSDYNEWKNNNVAMQQFLEARDFINGNLVRAYRPETKQWQRDVQTEMEIENVATDSYVPELRKLIEAQKRFVASLAVADEAGKELEQWNESNSEQYNENLTNLARGQLRDLQLKVASNPNYWQWGQDNYAVDEEGLPLIIFHGTTEGGFNEFTRFDVGEHIYGSTNVRTGATYSGGWTDDITPCFATDVSDIEQTLRSSKEYRLAEYSDGYVLHKRLDSHDRILTAATPEELVVKWNRWIGDNTANLRTRGVYPLVYRLTNPMVVEGNGENWNRIPVMPATSDEIWDSPLMQAIMSKKAERMDNPIGEMALMTKHQRLISQTMKNSDSELLLLLNISDAVYDDMEANPVVKAMVQDGFRKKWDAAADAVSNLRGMSATFPQTLMRAVWNELMTPMQRNPALPEEYQRHYENGDNAKAEMVQREMLYENEAIEIYHEMMRDGDMLMKRLVKYIYDPPNNATTRDLADIAEAAGHDGIVFRDIRDHGGKGGPDLEYQDLEPADVFVAFSTPQVKSAHAPEFKQLGAEAKKFVYSAR